jgi:predicted outer membrane repeat protein
VVVDINNDQSPDLIICNTATKEIEIWEFIDNSLTKTDAISGFSYKAWNIAYGDFDNDGDIDIASSHRSSGLYVSFNEGDSWTTQHIEGSYGWQVIVEDFNNDGNLDIFDGVDWGYALLFYGDGSGNFSSGPVPQLDGYSNGHIRSLNAIELNNDDRIDLIGITSEWNSGGDNDSFLRAFLNNENSTTGNTEWNTSIGPDVSYAFNPEFVYSSSNSAGDIDKNGVIDVVAFNSDNEIVIFWGSSDAGNMSWTPQVLDTATGAPSATSIYDINDDGNLDIIAGGNTAFNNLLVYYGNGSQTLTPSTIDLGHGAAVIWHDIKTADFNQDGQTDIITTISDGGFELLTSSRTSPMTLFVDLNATGENNGLSWQDAFNDLQDALNYAISGDEIWVASGTYHPTSEDQRDATFTLPDAVKIYGGFSGIETNLEERNPDINTVTLSGDIGIQGDNSDNSYHVVTAINVTSATILDGFTITKGYADQSGSPNDRGAGIFHESNEFYGSSELTVRNCIIEDNHAAHYGGGICNAGGGRDANILLDNCIIENNSAGQGGGMYNYGSGNEIYPTIQNCIFLNNNSTSTGGAIHNGAFGTGGECHPTFINSKFISNSSDGNGGAMYNISQSAGPCTPRLIGCVFYDNTTPGSGGAMVNYEANAVITNCNIIDNNAKWGGGITNSFSSPTITNTIFWHNSATNLGDQLYNYSATPSIAFSNIMNSGGSGSWDTALGQDNGNNLDADPLMTDPSNGDFRLTPTSPCINAGTPDISELGLPEKEIFNNPRILNENIEIGAHEKFTSTGQTIIFVDTDAQGNNNGNSWENAFNDLANAIDFSDGEDTFWVAEGTYHPTTGSDRTLSFSFPDNSTVLGGFSGTETASAEKDAEAHQTILSGDIGTQDEQTDNSYQIVNGANYLVLDGFIIEEGYANGTSPNDLGAGMYNPTGLNDISIKNCIFRNNTAISQGGAIFNDQYISNIKAENCDFFNNSANESGAIKSQNTPMDLFYCSFVENSDESLGGAVMYWGSNSGTPAIRNCTFLRNTSGESSGGAIQCRASGINAQIKNCLFLGNTPKDISLTNSAQATVSYSRITQAEYSGTNNNMDEDPQFYNETFGNIALIECSPCIDAGDPTSPLEPDGSNADIGNYHLIKADDIIPEITVPETQNVEADASNSYTVSGNEFDPVYIYDDCQYSITNDYNNASTLDGANFPYGNYHIQWTITDSNGNDSSSSFEVNVAQYTQINDPKDDLFSVTPNPTQRFLEINQTESIPLHIEILDLSGNSVFKKQIKTETCTLDLSFLPKGLYLLRMSNQNRETTEKIIKQ